MADNISPVSVSGKQERRSGLLIATGVALIAFAFYIRTLAPTILYYSTENFDSAHLQVVAYVLGIPSYTGYPTYAMLSHVFTFLPFGEVAWRVNLASAVFGAGSVFVLFLVCRRLGATLPGAAVGALAFGVGTTFWSQAVIAEVYTLHILLTVSFLLALLIWRESRRDFHLVLAAFLGGFAMTNHLTSVFLTPSAALFVLLVAPKTIRRPALILTSAGAFLVGLLPYLYLPIRAAMEPPFVGAGPQPDPATLAGFTDLVSGGDFKGRMFAFGPSELAGRALLYLGDLVQNLNPALILVSIFGIVVLARRDARSLVLVSSVFLFNLVYALEYDIEDVEIYFVPTYLVLSMTLAVGAGFLISNFHDRRLRYVVAAILIVLVLVRVPSTFPEVNRSDDYLGREMISAVERNVKPDSTVLVHGRTLDYMQLVEDSRRDIRLEDPFYTADWVPRAEKSLRRGRPVYVMYPGATNLASYREAGFEAREIRAGMLYEIRRD